MLVTSYRGWRGQLWCSRGESVHQQETKARGRSEDASREGKRDGLTLQIIRWLTGSINRIYSLSCSVTVYEWHSTLLLVSDSARHDHPRHKSVGTTECEVSAGRDGGKEKTKGNVTTLIKQAFVDFYSNIHDKLFVWLHQLKKLLQIQKYSRVVLWGVMQWFSFWLVNRSMHRIPLVTCGFLIITVNWWYPCRVLGGRCTNGKIGPT